MGWAPTWGPYYSYDSANFITSLATRAAVSVATGDHVFVGYFYDDGAGGNCGVPTDTMSNSYATVATQQYDTFADSGCALYYCENANGASVLTVTAHVPVANSKPTGIVAFGFSGGLASGSLDQSNGTHKSSGLPMFDTALTPTTGNQLVLFACSSNSTPTWTAGTGFTLLFSQPFLGPSQHNLAIAYEIQTTATSRQTGFTAPAGAFAQVAGTFKSAAGGGAAPASGFYTRFLKWTEVA